MVGCEKQPAIIYFRLESCMCQVLVQMDYSMSSSHLSSVNVPVVCLDPVFIASLSFAKERLCSRTKPLGQEQLPSFHGTCSLTPCTSYRRDKSTNSRYG